MDYVSLSYMGRLTGKQERSVPLKLKDVHMGKRVESSETYTTYKRRVRSLQGNFRPRRFPCNYRKDEVNKLFIIWPFNYGPNNNNNNK